MDIFRYLSYSSFDQCMLEIWLWNLTLLFNHKFWQPAGQVWTVNSTLINWCCTGWFMTCGHYCTMRFSRSLWSKNLISVWVLFWTVMKLWVFFLIMNALMWTVYHKSHYMTLNRNTQWKMQFATHTVHNRAAGWVAAVSGIFKNLRKAQVCVNWR